MKKLLAVILSLLMLLGLGPVAMAQEGTFFAGLAEVNGEVISGSTPLYAGGGLAVMPLAPGAINNILPMRTADIRYLPSTKTWQVEVAVAPAQSDAFTLDFLFVPGSGAGQTFPAMTAEGIDLTGTTEKINLDPTFGTDGVDFSDALYDDYDSWSVGLGYKALTEPATGTLTLTDAAGEERHVKITLTPAGAAHRIEDYEALADWSKLSGGTLVFTGDGQAENARGIVVQEDANVFTAAALTGGYYEVTLDAATTRFILYAALESSEAGKQYYIEMFDHQGDLLNENFSGALLDDGYVTLKGAPLAYDGTVDLTINQATQTPVLFVLTGAKGQRIGVVLRASDDMGDPLPGEWAGATNPIPFPGEGAQELPGGASPSGIEVSLMSTALYGDAAAAFQKALEAPEGTEITLDLRGVKRIPLSVMRPLIGKNITATVCYLDVAGKEQETVVDFASLPQPGIARVYYPGNRPAAWYLS